MAIIKNIQEKNEIKVDITRFFDVEESVWITIRKMDAKLKQKVQIMSMASMNNPTGKQLLKKLIEKNIEIEDYDKLPKKEQAKIMLDLDFDVKEQEEMSTYALKVQQEIINSCVDSKNHNIYLDDAQEKKYTVNWDFFNACGDEELIKFVIDEIKNISQSFILKKKTVTESTTQSNVSLPESDKTETTII